jgi:hypothetical protein
MKTKQRTIVILTLIIAMMTQIIPAHSADSPILQVSAEDIYLKAGQENTIKIVLKNTGDFKIKDVEAFLSSPVSGLIVLKKANHVIQEIDHDKSTSYQPTIYVDQNLPLGAYSLSITVTYRGIILQDAITVPIGVVLSEAFTPSIVYSPSLEKIDVISGTVNNVEFRFTNIQNDVINDLIIILSSPTSSITITNNIITTIGELNASDSLTLNSTISIIEGTPLGAYTITAVASYKDVDGNRFHQTFSLPINIASAAAVRTTLITIEEMKIIEDSIRPGDIFTVELTVKCSGVDAYDLLCSLGFPATSPISPIGPSVVSLGDLEAGKVTKAIYTLLASGGIPAGQYPLTATISYINNRGVAKTVTETLTVLVDGLIDFDLLDVPSEVIAPGETKELEADLLLIGTESVEFVSIEVVEDSIIKRVRGSDEYIGAVDPDSPIPFDVNYKVDEDAEEGSHELSLNVQYRDHLNREHKEQIRLEIDISGAIDKEPTQQQSWIWFWIRRILGLGP